MRLFTRFLVASLLLLLGAQPALQAVQPKALLAGNTALAATASQRVTTLLKAQLASVISADATSQQGDHSAGLVVDEDADEEDDDEAGKQRPHALVAGHPLYVAGPFSTADCAVPLPRLAGHLLQARPLYLRHRSLLI